MELRNVDADLVDICKQIVAGVDNNHAILPESLIDKFGGSVQGAREHAVYSVIMPSDDHIQLGSYIGGKNQDGAYSFAAHDGKKGEITITEQEARDIVAGKLKKVKIIYEKPK